MEFITIQLGIARLPLAYPKQLTEDFKLKTQEVTFLFRGFMVAPVVDSNGLKLAYTGRQSDITALSYNSSIVVDISEFSQQLFFGFGGIRILKYLDAKNQPLPIAVPWQGSVQLGDNKRGFLTYPFNTNHVEMFTVESNPSYFTKQQAKQLMVEPPPYIESPLVPELVSDKVSGSTKKGKHEND